MSNKQTKNDLPQKLKGYLDIVGVVDKRYNEGREPTKNDFFAAKGMISVGIGDGNERLQFALKS
ncbi:hypothetical protein [Thaumasiovibrio subtropicus]|uniref:hypothetical protein n=1 Tax=Thaumasiovibrio subtropicus TaxID=1891207 RepID=UPI000B34DD15|nr:hypothetical protein [Thaumasiovibrio subtropicus]